MRAGWTPPGPPTGFPRIPGNEFAGVIDVLGEGVTGFTEGQHVLGFTVGSGHAEYVVVETGQVAPRPAALPWEVAGALSAAHTADSALRELAVGAGEVLLVHAAAGGVGSAAVQLGVRGGATVIGTAREDNHDYLRSLGALPVAYGPGLLDRVRELAPAGVDAALDGAGGDALEVSLLLVQDRDRILTLTEHRRAQELGIRVVRTGHTAARRAELAELVARGELAVHIRRTYPLAQAADAHRDVESGHGRGRVVLTTE
ncbi:NADP-dependent oxidoreductase [Sphaerisporangium sp. NBC_01403]